MKREAGFTLLEMLVSLSVFSVALFIIMVTLFSVFNAQRKAIAIQNAQDNLRFAFEHMTKEIRVGRVFHCGISGTLTQPQNCPSGSIPSSFSFKNDVGQTVTYEVVSNQLVKSSTASRPCDNNPPTLADCQRITAPEVVIVDRIAFYVDGSAAFDGKQDRITIILEGQVRDPRGIGTAELNLQTTVSKRSLVDQP